MRGNKKLIQRISKAGATGILACAVSFSLPQIMQTEDTLLKGYGISGSMFELGESDLFSEVLSRAVSFGRNDMITVEAAARDSKKLYLSGNIVKTQNGSSDSLIDDLEEKDDTSNTTADIEENNEDDVKAKANTIKENAKTADTETNVKTAETVQKSKQKTNEKTSSKTVAASEDDTKKNKSDKTAAKEQTSTDKKAVVKAKTASTKKTDKKTEATEKSVKPSSEAKKWKNKLMADVDDRLNIRKSSSEDSEIVGRLRKGDVAKVLKKGKEWTKIKSGTVTGYVKNEYCVYGAKAYKLAKKVCETYATVQTDGLRIRQKPSEKSTILDAAYKGDKLTVNTKGKEKEGWVVVELESLDGYVSEEYVNVALGTGKALSIEEEMAQIAAEKKAQEEAAAKAAAQNTAAKSVSASSSSAVSSNNSPVQAASSDLTLLSAIIYCEAGGESYAGQVAVGAVVMNRVNSGSFPNSISGVVYQSGQFSPVANGALSRALSNGSYQNCVSAAREALAGSDNTGGAKFFHRVNGDAGLVIGNHVFY